MRIVRRNAVAVIAFAAVFACTLPAFADRPPTARERSQIEAALRAHGFIRWGDIELDDGMWEVDNAVTRDGRRYDLELSRRSLGIVDRDRDD